MRGNKLRKALIGMKKAFVTVLFILTLTLTGCGVLGLFGSKKDRDDPKDDTASVSESGGTDAGNDAGKDDVTKPEPEPAKEPDENDTAKGETSDSSDESSDALSLAKRLEGRYSYHYGPKDATSDSDEFLIMHVISFGDNLYAYCGYAFDDDYETFESYSFWATEFIPEQSEDLKSTDKDSVTVTALNFSVMSNLGQYWDTGNKGTITFTEDGLVFEGFGHDGFLVPENDDSRLFLKDDRAEEAFCYLKKDERNADPDIEGLWKLEEKDAPVFYLFEGNNLYVYQKKKDHEVFFAGGGCEFQNGTFSCTASVLGTGSMPYDWKGEYKVSGDKLTLSLDEDPLTYEPSKLTLTRADQADIPVITMDDVVFTEDSFGFNGAWDIAYTQVYYENGFYGIWTSAGKDRNAEIEKAKKLVDLGYDACVLYSPEWEGLNTQPYYCVTAGRFQSEEEAEEALPDVKKAGYSDTYVKFSGKCRYTMINYTNFGDLKTEVYSDKIILRDVSIVISQSWYPSIEEESPVMDLVIDKDTLFDDTCEMEFFGNYEEGDTPFEWYAKNAELMEKDPDQYSMYGHALSGVFEVGIRKNRIDRYFGSYWWD